MTTQDPPSQNPSKEASKPPAFPSITGSCVCNTIRYRLLTSPLFCYACHCPDCQKTTGSAFGLFLNIESYNIKIISPTSPVRVTQTKRPGLVSRHMECPQCRVELWSYNALGPAVADVRVGTLNYPGLMEPDIHSFFDSKLDWFILPEGARSVPGDFNHKELWPKSSLKRLDACLKRVAAFTKIMTGEEKARGLEDVLEEGGVGARADDGAGDGEKTPTAGEFGAEVEDDEAFEKRYKETEKALQERLAKLSKKLEDEDNKQQADLEKLTSNLEIADSQSKKADETT